MRNLPASTPHPSRRVRRSAAFTLTELMVALGLLLVGTSIAYPLFVGDFNLYIRNFSLNKSDNSLRASLQSLKSDIDMAIEPPWLVNYSVSGSTGVLTPQDSTVSSATGILLWVNLGQAFDMIPSAGSDTGGIITPPTGVKLRYSTPLVVMPQVGDRLVIMSPTPYTPPAIVGTPAMADSVKMPTPSGAPIQKPGRRITSVKNNGDGTITVQLDLTNPLPSGITGDQSVFVVREVAYVINTNAKSTERQLLRYATTANMTNPGIVIRDLDPTPQEKDTNTGSTVQPFNYYGGRGTLSPLTIILPIRALDYAQTIADHRLSAGTVDTSTTEFNVYLRSNTQMGVKARLD